jgi:hypothetical protein
VRKIKQDSNENSLIIPESKFLPMLSPWGRLGVFLGMTSWQQDKRVLQ